MSKKRKEARTKMSKDTTSFPRVQVEEISFSRRGKHHKLLLRLFADLETLPKGEAIAIPKSELKTKFENVRAAIKHLCRKESLKIKTGSDMEHFYIWKL